MHQAKITAACPGARPRRIMINGRTVVGGAINCKSRRRGEKQEVRSRQHPVRRNENSRPIEESAADHRTDGSERRLRGQCLISAVWLIVTDGGSGRWQGCGCGEDSPQKQTFFPDGFHGGNDARSADGVKRNAFWALFIGKSAISCCHAKSNHRRARRADGRTSVETRR